MQASELSTGLAESIRDATWKLFKQKYASKFKKPYSESVFTVVASIALVDRHEKSFEIASLGFGTKTLPQSIVSVHQKESLIEDMHAEQLATRGFKRFVLQETKKKESLYLEWLDKKQKYRLVERFSVVLYCSEIFCGDCCVDQEQQSFSGAKPLKYLNSKSYPQLKFEANIVRTKPGRLDLPIEKRSAILSCSDLLGFYNLVGIQGQQLFNLITPVYIQTAIVEGTVELRQTVQRGIDLVKRLSTLLHRPQSLVKRQLFNIVINKKQRKISSQFRHNRVQIVLLSKSEEERQSRDHEGLDLCGIGSRQDFEWLNGKSGLPEGSSLKTYLTKGKVSLFSQKRLRKDFQQYKDGKDTFKYEAVRQRVKLLFRQWLI